MADETKEASSKPGDRGTAGEKATASHAESSSSKARTSRGAHGERVIHDDDDNAPGTVVEDEQNPGRYVVPGSEDTGHEAPIADGQSGGEAPISAGVNEFIANAKELTFREKRRIIDAFASALGVTPQETTKPGLTLNERVSMMHVNHEATNDLSEADVKKIAKLVGIEVKDIASAAVRQQKDWRGQPGGTKYVRVVTHQGRKKVAELA